MDTTNFEDFQPVEKSYTVTSDVEKTPVSILKRGHMTYEGYPDEIGEHLGYRLPHRKLRMRVDFEVIE